LTIVSERSMNFDARCTRKCTIKMSGSASPRGHHHLALVQDSPIAVLVTVVVAVAVAVAVAVVVMTVTVVLNVQPPLLLESLQHPRRQRAAVAAVEVVVAAVAAVAVVASTATMLMCRHLPLVEVDRSLQLR